MSNPLSSKLESILRAGGVAPKETKVFGSHCIVTLWSHDAARKVFRLFQAAGFANLKLCESVDYLKENKGTCLNPSVQRVWIVGARMTIGGAA